SCVADGKYPPSSYSFKGGRSVMKRLRFFLLAALAVAVASLGTIPAEGAFKLRVSDGTTTVTVQDNMAGDLNPAVGVILVSQTFASGAIVTVNVGVSKPQPPNSASLAFMDIGIVATAPAGTVLTIDLTDTDFNLFGPPINMHSDASNNSSAVVTQTFQEWFGTNNAEFTI